MALAVSAGAGGGALVGFDGSTVAGQMTAHVGHVVGSVAEMAALNPALYTQAQTTSFHGDGKGGGSGFTYQATTAQTQANGATVIASTYAGATGCWVMNRNGGPLSIRQFGAKCDGSDDGPALQAVWVYAASRNSGGTPSINQPVNGLPQNNRIFIDLEGASVTVNSVVVAPACAGITFGNGTIRAGAACTAVAIALLPAGSNWTEQVAFKNVTFDGAHVCRTLVSARHSNAAIYSTCRFVGWANSTAFNGTIAGTKLTINSGAAPVVGQSISSLPADAGVMPVLPGTYVASSNGDGTFTVNNAQTVGPLAMSADGEGLQIIDQSENTRVINCVFEQWAFGEAGAPAAPSGNGLFSCASDVHVTNNFVTSAGIGFNVTGAGYLIRDNHIYGCASLAGVFIGAGGGSQVTDNLFDGVGLWSTFDIYDKIFTGNSFYAITAGWCMRLSPSASGSQANSGIVTHNQFIVGNDAVAANVSLTLGAGSGKGVHVIASGAVFSAGDVGKTIYLTPAEGMSGQTAAAAAQITGYTSATEVYVHVMLPFASTAVAAGSWSKAASGIFYDGDFGSSPPLGPWAVVHSNVTYQGPVLDNLQLTGLTVGAAGVALRLGAFSAAFSQDATGNSYLSNQNVSQYQYYQTASGGRHVFQVNGSTVAALSDQTAWIPAVYNTTTASAANVTVASDGTLQRSVSTGAMKTDVEAMDISHAQAIVMQSKPVWYRSIAAGDRSDWSWYSFIAEELANVDPRAATWGRPVTGTQKVAGVVGHDRNGPVTGIVETPVYGDPQPDGVNDRAMLAALVVVVQAQQKTIDRLTAQQGQ